MGPPRRSAATISIGIMPGTIKSVEQAMRIKGSAFHRRFQEIAMEGGIRIVTWWWTPGGFASRDRAIGGPDTVQGLKMRAADPTFELMLKEAGASVVSMPSTEIYPAMQSGVLNATLTSAETFVSMRIYEQTRYATIGGPNTLWMLLQPLVISTQAWNRLTPAQRQAFDEAADVADAWFAREQEEAAANAAEAFRKAVAEEGYKQASDQAFNTASWAGPADALKAIDKLDDTFQKLIKKYDLKPE